MKLLDLFSGIGGFSLGLERAGFQTVAFCEIEPYCRAVLKKHWPNVPIYEDVCSLTADRLRADGISVDAICGGFPCQDASVANTAGKQRLGIAGPRTGLWKHVVRLAADFPAAFLIMENVPGLLSAGFGDVLGDLATLRRDAEWDCISAGAVGLPHRRDRLWIVCYPERSRLPRHYQGQSILGAARTALSVDGDTASGAWRSLERDFALLRGGDGVSVAMERRRIKPLGNAVVPQIPEAIGRAIMASLI